jgi:serine/threonine-protein kinase
MPIDQRLTELLARWDDLRQQGNEVAAEQLCADCSDLIPELKSRIEQLKSMDWLENPCECGADQIHQDPAESPLATGLTENRVPAILGERYEMNSLIAEGAFGQVWRAVDTFLQRPVAVKVTVADCYTEARRVAQLKHQGIIAVHDVGSDRGLCYIVFDLIDGPTLAEKVREGTLTWQQSAQLVATVADSVQFAHEKGFIHRDIKPSNILINPDGKPVLADFGIAVTECELQHESLTSFGTLAYMAPEQLTIGDEVDVRTDVYGLGVVLYELMTGQLPFGSPTLTGLRERILTREPASPRLLNPQINVECERICLKCLSKAKEARFPTAHQLAEALRRV